MKMKNLFLLFCCFAVLTTCQRSNVAPESATIYGFWRYLAGVAIETNDGESGVIPLAYISLHEDGTMGGFTSRNILGGTFQQESPDIIKLNFTPLTRVYDTPWSSHFQERLSSVDRYRLEDDHLILINSSSGEELTFLKLSPNTCTPIPNSRQLYDQAESDPFTLEDVVVAGSCLEITISYSGGCGEIESLLIGSGDYMESLPVQLDIKFILDDEDPCKAIIRKSFYFNLNTILPPDEEEIILHLADWPLDIYYRRF